MTNSLRSSRGILLLSYWSGWCILYQNSFNFMFKISSFSFIVQRRYLNLRLTCLSNNGGSIYVIMINFFHFLIAVSLGV
uniref:Putative ovule protein n=1 Tax=Solanum chacoense TaxID=4108 RepID=A0A0V0HE25_SOLCH